MKNVLILFTVIFSFIAIAFSSNIQAQAPRAGKTYYIQSIVNSSRYLSTKNAGRSTSTRVVIDQKTSRKLTAMQWKMESVGGGYYRFIQKASNKALDVSGKRTAAKTPLWIWPKSNPGEAQKFRLKDGGNGYYYIIPKINDNMRLDIEGSRSTAGTGVWTFPRNGSRTQKWKFIEVSSSTPSSTSAPKAVYRVELISMTCIEEDDPGDEIEIFGKIKTRVYLDRDDSMISQRQILNIPSSRTIKLEEGDGYEARNAYFDFTVRKDYMDAGHYLVDFWMDLYEHDGSSANDQFGYGVGWVDVWKRSEGLPKTKSVTITEGDTKVLVKWRVRKLRDL